MLLKFKMIYSLTGNTGVFTLRTKSLCPVMGWLFTPVTLNRTCKNRWMDGWMELNLVSSLRANLHALLLTKKQLAVSGLRSIQPRFQTPETEQLH